MDIQATAMHRHTPKLISIDPRGLALRSVDYYRAAQEEVAEARVNRTVHDPVERAVAQWDPRLAQDASAPANLVTIHGVSGTALCTLSVDAGLRVSLFGEVGQSVQSWDSRGSQRWMHYDNLLRLTALFEQTAEGEAVCAERLTYAANAPALADHNQCGQLISHKDLAGVLQFNDYGLTGTLLEQERRLADIAQSFSTHSRFNPAGDLLSRTDAQGNEQRFNQTMDGQLRAVDLRLSHTTQRLPVVSAITYNAHGQVEREVAGNGVITTLEYAAEDGRLQRLLSRLGQNEPLQDLRYTFDPVGNVRSIEDAALPIRYFANQRIEPVSHFWYDTLDRLIAASGWEAGSVKHGPSSAMTADPAMPGNYRQTYRYDAGNNLLELTHVGPQNPGHRLVADAHSNRCLPVRDGMEPTEQDFRDSFDANGNLLTLQLGQTLRWDLRNQLCEVRLVERDGAESDSEQYVYGADGLRVRKVRSLQTNAQTVVIETLYLPGLEIRTHSGTGEVLHVIDVATGRGSVRVLHWAAGRPSEISNDQQRYCLTDHLGSSTLELDQHANVITQERFYPFGGTAWWNGTTVQVSYKTVRYSGKEQDATGLYYYGFRYYVPWLQRWLNPDPAGIVDGTNLFRALRNSPIRYHDQWGNSAGEPTDEENHAIKKGTTFLGRGLDNFPVGVIEPMKEALSYVVEWADRAAEELGAESLSSSMKEHISNSFGSEIPSGLVTDIRSTIMEFRSFVKQLAGEESWRLSVVDKFSSFSAGAQTIHTTEKGNLIWIKESLISGRHPMALAKTIAHEAFHAMRPHDSEDHIRDFWSIQSSPLSRSATAEEQEKYQADLLLNTKRHMKRAPVEEQLLPAAKKHYPAYFKRFLNDGDGPSTKKRAIGTPKQRAAVYLSTPRVRQQATLHNADSMAVFMLQFHRKGVRN
jgi:insecticidal toxin complex protein TccC